MGSFEDFLAGQTVHISPWVLLANLVIGAVLAAIISYVYTKYGNSLSNRTIFARDFFLLILTTVLVISVIKSSLALSLGLVGALSIVRFRAAIKEPEELSYLFFCIAIGLGLGADQRLITVIAFIVIVAVIIVRKRFFIKGQTKENLYLSVSSLKPAKIELEQIVDILRRYCSSVYLKRFDDTAEALEASFLVSFDGYDSLKSIREELAGISGSVKLTFLDSEGLR